jgi:hypothetical protein
MKPIGTLRIDTDGSLTIPEMHLIGDAIRFQIERKHKMRPGGAGLMQSSPVCGETVVTITFRGDVGYCLPPAKRKRGRG